MDNVETRKCGSCRGKKLINDFIGVRGNPTYKCSYCNTRANAFQRKTYVPTGNPRGKPRMRSSQKKKYIRKTERPYVKKEKVPESEVLAE